MSKEKLDRCFDEAMEITEYRETEKELVGRYLSNLSSKEEEVVNVFLSKINELRIWQIGDSTEGEDVLVEEAKVVLENVPSVKIVLVDGFVGTLTLYIVEEEYYLVGSGEEFGGESVAKFSK
jgi:hypothetical protein